jgi:hypothetical protein
MHRLTKRSVFAVFAGSAALVPFVFAGTALAAPAPGAMHGPRPVVMGTVASAPDASGTFTVASEEGWKRGGAEATSTRASSTTYTVTTNSSTVFRDGGATSTIAAITSGDRVMVAGTLSGTTITATSVMSGMMSKGAGMPPGMTMHHASTTPPFTGNGQPVIGGTIAAISGSSLTVTNKANVTYAVDASNATITKPGTTGATIANLAVGDTLVVQGSVNGTAVTASTIVDNGASSANGDGKNGGPRGFFGAIGGFFSHLFGFF